ncbi:MAG: hypothetical protein ACYCX4_01065 [Bacillota bacterium]
MRILKAILCLLFSLMLIVDVLALLLAADIKQTVLQPTMYDKVFYRNNVYSAVVTTISDNLEKQLLPAVPAPYQSKMEAELNEALNEQWVQRQVIGVTGELLGYLKGEVPTFSLNISLAEVKQSVINSLTDGLSPSEAREIEPRIKEMEDNIPDEVDMAESMGQEGQQPDLSMAVRAVGMIQRIPLMAGGAVFVLLLLIGLLNRFRLPMLRWLGAAMVTGGIIALLAAFIGPSTVASSISRAGMPQLPVQVNVAVLMDSLLQEIAAVLKASAAVTTVIGLIMIITPVFFTNKKNRSGHTHPVK